MEGSKANCWNSIQEIEKQKITAHLLFQESHGYYSCYKTVFWGACSDGSYTLLLLSILSNIQHLGLPYSWIFFFFPFQPKNSLEEHFFLACTPIQPFLGLQSTVSTEFIGF